ncbi:MAG TPA: amidase [Dongiaceae bacterium]|jgi:amidase|nr:amidase [Dongiaceae bacterium]
MSLSAAALATGAFCPHGDFEIPGAAGGPLRGLTFATKDIFDIAGRVTGCGNPDWLASHAPAAGNAPAVQKLLDSGARMVGKTITDELAFSLNGQNFHYGTPRNAVTPDRVPGGSSCGSASAVGHGIVDLALGSDTGGSVRIPACLNGIFGIRPTHGAVDIAGVMPLAPSFDTVGWFARDAKTLRRAGEVLLPADRSGIALSRFYVARDAFAIAERPVADAVRDAIAKAGAALLVAAEFDLATELGGLPEWLKRFRRLQPREIWAIHGAWIEARKPKFGPEIAERFALAKSVSATPEGDDEDFRTRVAAHLDRLLGLDGVLLTPSAGTIAPRLDAGKEELTQFRDRTLSLTCIAGLGRLPQVQVPAGLVGGATVGLSLVGPRGSDRALLALAEKVAAALS